MNNHYITHHRYKEIGICGKQFNLPYGTILLVVDDTYLTDEDGNAVCFITSENAKKHFATNYDGKGLTRGELTYFIAYSKLDHTPRFDKEIVEYLITNHNKWLRQDLDVIRFNEDFFKADVEELQELADYLKEKWSMKK